MNSNWGENEGHGRKNWEGNIPFWERRKRTHCDPWVIRKQNYRTEVRYLGHRSPKKTAIWQKFSVWTGRWRSGLGEEDEEESGKGKGSNSGPRVGRLGVLPVQSSFHFVGLRNSKLIYYMIFECNFSLILKMFSLCKIILLNYFYKCLKPNWKSYQFIIQ